MNTPILFKVASIEPTFTVIPEDQVVGADLAVTVTHTPDALAKMKILDDLRKELDRLKAQVRDATTN